MNEVKFWGLDTIEIGDVGGGEVVHFIIEDDSSISEHLGTKIGVDRPVQIGNLIKYSTSIFCN